MATVETVGATVTPYYVHTDTILGSNVVTDSTGARNQLLDYFPYGDVRINQQATSFNEKNQFGGHLYDAGTDLNYFGARYYNAKTGQFISEDPSFWTVGSDAQQLANPQAQNSYLYAGNNPINKIDPNGKCFWDGCIVETMVVIEAAELIGTAIGAAYAAHDVGTVAGTAMSDAPASYKNGVYDSIAGNWAGIISAGSGLSPGVSAEEESAVSALSGVQANKAAGDAFESLKAGELRSNGGYPQVEPQITLRTQSGIKTRIDITARDSAGNTCLFECKSSVTAPLTKNQSLAFPEIAKTGATVVGQGKPGFPGGTVIPPTNVTILRP